MIALLKREERRPYVQIPNRVR